MPQSPEDRTWSSLLTGDLAEEAWKSAVEVAGVLASASDELSSPWLADGYAGISLFYTHFAACSNDEHSARLAERFLAKAADDLERHKISPALFTGLAGICWVHRHLTDLLGRETLPDLVEEFDDALAALIKAPRWDAEFDLIHGLTGIGCYALAHSDPAFARVVLDGVIEHLDANALRSPQGLVWWTEPRWLRPEVRERRDPRGYADFGMAHGNAGIVALLSQILLRHPAERRIEALLREGVHWLLANQRGALRGSVFPLTLEPDEKIGSSARSAWCYGDPGIAVSLIGAGLACDEPEWIRVGIETARRDCDRPEELTGVEDAGLCHGATGLAHLYNRLYQATGVEEFSTNALRWYQRALDMRMTGPERIAGYAAWSSRHRRSVPARGLLNGATGVGLALISAVRSHEPYWDRAFLLNLPPRHEAELTL